MLSESPICHRANHGSKQRLSLTILLSWLMVVAGIGLCLCTRHIIAGETAAQQTADVDTHTAPPAPPSHEPPVPTVRSKTPIPTTVGPIRVVKSKMALVVDANTGEVLLQKNADLVTPIASITKLMTAIVVLNAQQAMDEVLTIADSDRDFLMGTTSRLNVGWSLTREEMLHLALMSSENRAAAALSRCYPGGRPAFIKAMNDKAAELGMTHTHFVNANGLTPENLSTAHDLVKLVQAAYGCQLIRQYSTDPGYEVHIGKRILPFVNSDRLVGRPDWDIEVQKTGFINDSGHCLVMRVNADGRELVMVFLDAVGKLTRFADARRVRTQLALIPKKQG